MKDKQNILQRVMQFNASAKW